MNELIQATAYVLGDEKALVLYEENRMSPMGSRRRYEVIWVVRDDRPAEYRHDMVKVTNVDLVRIPSYMEHKVNELREMANQLKLKPVDKLDLVGLDKIIEETGTNLTKGG